MPAQASRTMVAVPEEPKAKSAKSAAASTTTGPTRASVGRRSSRNPMPTVPTASATPTSSRIGATARSGRPLTRVTKAVTYV